jgi:hypothetical protein
MQKRKNPVGVGETYGVRREETPWKNKFFENSDLFGRENLLHTTVNIGPSGLGFLADGYKVSQYHDIGDPAYREQPGR